MGTGNLAYDEQLSERGRITEYTGGQSTIKRFAIPGTPIIRQQLATPTRACHLGTLVAWAARQRKKMKDKEERASEDGAVIGAQDLWRMYHFRGRCRTWIHCRTPPNGICFGGPLHHGSALGWSDIPCSCRPPVQVDILGRRRTRLDCIRAVYTRPGVMRLASRDTLSIA